ncbi:hypothetical protein WJX84_010532 [Apatococcus fuscideae]|uniref:Peptidase S49 domain-containing protein n=1 Tax=Apatococcus fuscideae TaxID=2026836 RepID=A0AAW1T9Y5_9CHLO
MDYGIRPEIVTEGKNADSLSPFSGFNPGFREDGLVFQQILGPARILSEYTAASTSTALWIGIYDGFVDLVATQRKMSHEDVLKIAQGRVWTGADALKRGLVDQLGGLQDAISLAKAEAGFSGEEAQGVQVRYGRTALAIQQVATRLMRPCTKDETWHAGLLARLNTPHEPSWRCLCATAYLTLLTVRPMVPAG